jgi:hypothetical protein
MSSVSRSEGRTAIDVASYSFLQHQTMHDTAAAYSTVLLLSLTSNSGVSNDMSLKDAIRLHAHAGLLQSVTSETKFECAVFKDTKWQLYTFNDGAIYVTYTDPPPALQRTVCIH